MADPIINRGAQLAAAARTLGMSLPEAEAFVAKKAMRAGVPEDAAMAQFLQKMAAVAQLNEEIPERIDDKRTIPNSEVEYGEFGNQDDFQNFGGGVDARGNRLFDLSLAEEEKAKVAGKKNPNEIVRYYYDKVNKKPAQEVFYAGDGMPIPERFQEAAKAKDFGLYRQDVPAPAQQVLRGELARLQAGVDQFGADAFPGIADAIGRIEDDLRVDAGAERALAGELVRRDRQGLPTNEAEAKALLEYNRLYGDAPSAASPNLNQSYNADINVEAERAARIKAAGVNPQGPGRLVGGMAGGPSREERMQALVAQFKRGNFNPEIAERNDWEADYVAQNIARERFGINGLGAQADINIGKIGDIQKIGHAKVAGDFNVSMPVPGRQVEPTALPIGLANDLNAPVTDNRFAGPLQKQQQWLVDHAPGFREGKIFGDYPQVAIGEQLGNVEEALAKIKIGKQGLDPSVLQIRNLEDLQRAADAVNALAGPKGFNIREGGENIHVANGGIHEMLRKARFNENQENNLARALYAVEALNPGGARGVAMRDAFIRGESVRGQGEMGGRRLVAIQGEGGKEYRVVREPNKQPVGGAQHQLLGGGQIPIARIGREKIEGREVKGELQKLQGRQADPPLDFQELRAARMPDQGARGGEKAPRAHFIRGEDAQLSTAELIAKHGKARGELAAGVRRRAIEDDARRQAAAPPQNVMGRIEAPNPNKGIGQVVPGLQYEARPRVIEPDPWTQPVGTGHGINQASPAPTAPRPQLALPYGSGDNPFGVQGPEEGNIGRRAYSYAKNFAKSPQHKRGRRIAYGVGGGSAALTGLAALIGGERDRREEEVYQ